MKVVVVGPVGVGVVRDQAERDGGMLRGVMRDAGGNLIPTREKTSRLVYVHVFRIFCCCSAAFTKCCIVLHLCKDMVLYDVVPLLACSRMFHRFCSDS